MKKKSVFILFFIFLSLLPVSVTIFLPYSSNIFAVENQKESTDDKNAGSENIFFGMKKLHLKWNTGLFKSARYYRKYMTRYIIENVNKEIRTDYRYRIISPEGLYGKKLECNFLIEDWLLINGNIDRPEILKIIDGNTDLLARFWRSQKVLSVSGIIKNYKFDVNEDKVIVILYLDRIKLFERDINDTEKNSK